MKKIEKINYVICRKTIKDEWEFKKFKINKDISQKKALEKAAEKMLETISEDCIAALLFCEAMDKDEVGYYPVSLSYRNPNESGIIMEGCREEKLFTELNKDVLNKIMTREIRVEVKKENRKVLGLNYIQENMGTSKNV